MIVGMAKSGIASARLLLDHGARVVLYDAKTEDKFPSGLDAFKGRAEFCTGRTGTGGGGSRRAGLSPSAHKSGFYHKGAARRQKVIGEIELGFLFSQAEFVAITGTNGKTTTTAHGEIFKNAGFNTFAGQHRRTHRGGDG